MRIVKIGAITLSEPMWVKESNNSDGVNTEVVNNLDGGIIIFEQTTKTSKKNFTIESKSYAWQTEAIVDALVALANGSLGQSFTVEEDGGSTYSARFRNETKGGAVQFKRLIDAKLFEWYTGVIYMAKV